MSRKIVRKALDDLKVSEAAFSKVIRYIGEIPQGELMQLIQYYNPKYGHTILGNNPNMVTLDEIGETKAEEAEEDSGIS